MEEEELSQVIDAEREDQIKKLTQSLTEAEEKVMTSARRTVRQLTEAWEEMSDGIPQDGQV